MLQTTRHIFFRFYSFCDVYDEEFDEALAFYSDEEMARAPEQHRIEVPKGCHWKDIIAASKIK